MFDNETLLFKYNIDANGNPISIKVDNEQKQVSINGTIQMEFVPDEFNRIDMLDENNQQMYEVFNRDEITTNTYYVDYSSGTIYYDKSQFGKVKIYNYYNRGLQLIGASRLYDEKSITGEGIVKTLQDIIDEGRKCLELIKSLGDAVIIINKLQKNLDDGNILHENLLEDISIGSAVRDDLEEKTDIANTTINSLVTKTQDGNNTVNQLIEKNAIATEKKQALDESIQSATDTNTTLSNTNQAGTQINLTLQQTIAEASDDIATINATGNKSLIIGASNFTNGEYTWTHSMNNDNLIVSILSTDTNEPIIADYKIIDKNNILIRNSEENPNLKVILSASYYQGNSVIGSTVEEFLGDSIGTDEDKVRLRGVNGEVQNPVTNSDAVFMTDGTTKLTKKINDMDNDFIELFDEISDARGDNQFLGDRLSNIDASLADINGNKADKINVNSLTVPLSTADSINATILTAYNLKINNVFIPKLTTDYVLDKEILVRSGIRLYSNGAVLKPSGGLITTKSPLIRNYSFGAVSYIGDTNITIEGFVIDCNNKSCTGVALAHTSNCTIRNNIVRNIIAPSHGMDLAGNRNLIIDNNILVNCQSGGIQIDACMTGSIPVLTSPALNEDNTNSLNIKIINNYFEECNSGAVHLHKTGHTNISIIDNYFINCSSGIVDDNNYNSSHKNVKILNNYFEGNGETLSAIVFYAGHNNLYVDKNTFKNCKNGIILSQNIDNTNLYNYLKITNNTFDSCVNAQIKVENAYKGLIDGNLIRIFGIDDTTEVNGVEILKSNYVKVVNNDIYSANSKLMRNGIKWGINCDNIILSHNSLVSLENGIFGGTQSNFITITQNTIRNCNSKGVVIESFSSQMKNISIEGNTIDGTLDYAIRTANTEGVSVSNNIINNSALQKASISLNTCEKGVVIGNVVNGGTIGISVSSNSTTKKGLNVVSNNMITASTNGVELLNGSQDNIISQNIVKGQLTISDTTSNIVVNNKIVA